MGCKSFQERKKNAAPDLFLPLPFLRLGANIPLAAQPPLRSGRSSSETLKIR
jgi:hypothetical protein